MPREFSSDHKRPAAPSEPGSPNPKGISAHSGAEHTLSINPNETRQLVVTLVNDTGSGLTDASVRLWTEGADKLTFALRDRLLPPAASTPHPFTYTDVTSGNGRTTLSVKWTNNTYTMAPGFIISFGVDIIPTQGTSGTFTLKAALRDGTTDMAVYTTVVEITST